MSSSLQSLDPKDYPPGYFQEYSGDILVRISIAFIVLQITFVILRYLSRGISKTKVGLDDLFVYPALLANLAQCGLTLASVYTGGAGHHLAAALILKGPLAFQLWSKIALSLILVFLLSVALSKLVISALYLRIFVDRPYRIATYVVAGIIVLTALPSMLATTFQCTPVAFFWDKTLDGYCMSASTVGMTYVLYNVPNLLTDAALLILPIPMVLKLKKSGVQKALLLLTFLTGGMGFIASIVRIAIFSVISNVEDPTWNAVPLTGWTIVESGMYLIAACLPSLRPLVLHVARHPLLHKVTDNISSKSSSGHQSLSKKSYSKPFFRLSSNRSGQSDTAAPSTASAGAWSTEITKNKTNGHDIEMGLQRVKPAFIKSGTIEVRHDVYVI